MHTLAGTPANICFSPTAESFVVSGSGVVWGGPELRFHEDSTRVPTGFHQGSARAAGWCELGISPELIYFLCIYIYI